jgi:hypothetical protein
MTVITNNDRDNLKNIKVVCGTSLDFSVERNDENNTYDITIFFLVSTEYNVSMIQICNGIHLEHVHYNSYKLSESMEGKYIKFTLSREMAIKFNNIDVGYYPHDYIIITDYETTPAGQDILPHTNIYNPPFGNIRGRFLPASYGPSKSRIVSLLGGDMKLLSLLNSMKSLFSREDCFVSEFNEIQEADGIVEINVLFRPDGNDTEIDKLLRKINRVTTLANAGDGIYELGFSFLHEEYEAFKLMGIPSILNQNIERLDRILVSPRRDTDMGQSEHLDACLRTKHSIEQISFSADISAIEQIASTLAGTFTRICPEEPVAADTTRFPMMARQIRERLTPEIFCDTNILSNNTPNEDRLEEEAYNSENNEMFTPRMDARQITSETLIKMRKIYKEECNNQTDALIELEATGRDLADYDRKHEYLVYTIGNYKELISSIKHMVNIIYGEHSSLFEDSIEVAPKTDDQVAVDVLKANVAKCEEEKKRAENALMIWMEHHGTDYVNSNRERCQKAVDELQIEIDSANFMINVINRDRGGNFWFANSDQSNVPTQTTTPNYKELMNETGKTCTKCGNAVDSSRRDHLEIYGNIMLGTAALVGNNFGDDGQLQKVSCYCKNCVEGFTDRILAPFYNNGIIS